MVTDAAFESPSGPSRPGRLSRRAFVKPNHLEFDVQVSGEPIVLTRWINSGGLHRDSARAEIVIVPPTVGVGQPDVHRGAQIVCRLNCNAVKIQLTIENIIVDQVWIERELLGVLIPNVDLPIVLLLQLADTEPSLIRVALAALARLACGGSAVVPFKIGREVAVYPHRYSPRFPAEFHWHIEHQKAVDAGLVRREGIRVR